MAHSEDHIALAAEYALGTLDADERAQVETMMAVDTEFTAIVHAWEYRLGVLNQMVGSVEPRPIVWENIKAAIGHSAGQQAALVLPEAPPSPSPPPGPPAEPVAEPVAAPVVAEAPPAATDNSNDNSNVIPLPGRAKRWRNVASVATALAAALVGMLAVQVYQPELLPDALRPKPRIQTVEVKTPAPSPVPSAQYVALLQRDARLARLHPDGRRRDQKFHRPQGRGRCRARQEL